MSNKDHVITVRLNEADHERLKEMVAKMDTTISSIVRDATKLYAEETGYVAPRQNVMHEEEA